MQRLDVMTTSKYNNLLGLKYASLGLIGLIVIGQAKYNFFTGNHVDTKTDLKLKKKLTICQNVKIFNFISFYLSVKTYTCIKFIFF